MLQQASDQHPPLLFYGVNAPDQPRLASLVRKTTPPALAGMLADRSLSPALDPLLSAELRRGLDAKRGSSAAEPMLVD